MAERPSHFRRVLGIGSLVVVGTLWLAPAIAADLAGLLGSPPKTLSAEQAFAPQLLAGADGRLQVQFTVAPGHYLYRDRVQATDASGAPLAIALPPGEPFDDPEFGRVAVLRGTQTLHIDRPAEAGVRVDVRYQGCAQGRLCYAPVVTRLQLTE